MEGCGGRSKRNSVTEKPLKEENHLEEAVIGALRIGDVRKALQMLNSAPIAEKTPATLACLHKLHPKGDNPAPVAPQEVPHLTEDVVRKALSSFGFGYIVAAMCASRVFSFPSRAHVSS